ncbi:MAG: ABC transporter permease [Armatimonadetes bacterium]|nr:ABC transporter permease [Armatimonadota bacterium]
MPLLRFVGRRLALLGVVLLLVSALIFGVVQILPGDVATMILGTYATPGDLAALRQTLGLTRPALLRYLDWITGALRGDWGTSLLYRVPVRPLVLDRLSRSAFLAVIALAVAVPLAIALGVVSAWYRHRFVDHTIGTATLIAVSLPEFVTGTAMILLFAFRLRLLPPSSLVDPRAGLLKAGPSLVLPVLTLVLVSLAHMTRMTRANMIEIMERPFVRAARLRGLRPRRVLLAHALRNAMLPTIGIVALNIGFAIGGLVVVETVFAYPGLGRLLVDSINHRDVPVIQMAAMVVAAAYALANLAADIAYAYLDPRIRY